MLEWPPTSVQALGRRNATALNGDMLEIDEGLADEVIAALAAEGIEGQKDREGLVAVACGEWRY